MIKVSEKLDQLTSLLRQFGAHHLAYSTLQDGLAYHVYKNGYIAYKQINLFAKKVIIVLGDPICEPNQVPELINDFLTMYPNALFALCSDRVVENINRPMTITHCGNEHIIWPEQFDISWSSHPSIKQALSRVDPDLIVTAEPYHHYPEWVLNDIHRQWCDQKKSRHYDQSFLTRPFSPQDDQAVQFFSITKHRELIGYCVCDPIYKDNQVTGYYINQLRYLPSHRDYIGYFTITEIIKYLKQYQPSVYLSLGLAPFSPPYRIDNSPFCWISTIFKGLYHFLGIVSIHSKESIHLKTFLCNTRTTLHCQFKKSTIP